MDVSEPRACTIMKLCNREGTDKEKVGQFPTEAEKQVGQTAHTHKTERITLTNHRLSDSLHFLSIKRAAYLTRQLQPTSQSHASNAIPPHKFAVFSPSGGE